MDSEWRVEGVEGMEMGVLGMERGMIRDHEEG